MAASDFLGPVGNSTRKYETGNPALRYLLDRFFVSVGNALAVAQPATLLDVGCGEGEATERLAALAPKAQVTGVDDESLAPEWALRQGTAMFQPGSGYDLPFPDRSFDLVCALEVLEHVARPGAVFEEMRRVSNRWILASVPNEPLWRISHMAAGRDLRAFGNTPGHINHWTRRSFARLAGGFGEVVWSAAPFPWVVVLARTA